jgi:predicted nucleic acid-binding protein
LIFYLDASALVPTLIREAASAVVDDWLLAATEDLAVGEFAAAETASALSRLVRMGHLADTDAARLLGEFDVWRAAAACEVDIQPSDIRLASLFVRRFDLGLRAPDALHAAICRRGGHTLVTMDRRLAAAAEALGVICVCLA